MTSNVGAELIKGGGASFGFAKRDEEHNYENMKNLLLKEIERYFRPEFINRLDDVIVFRPLTQEDLVGIVEYEMKKVYDRVVEQGLTLELAESAKDFLIDKGYNPDFGARPLRRAIEQYVEDPLSEAILRSEFSGKNVIHVEKRDEDEDQLHFEARYEPPAEPAEDEKSGSEDESADAEATTT